MLWEADAGAGPGGDVLLSSRGLRLPAGARPASAFREVDVV